MQFWIANTLHPERYHGRGRKPPFFEGWYFKLIDPSEQHRYAIIPGIFLSDDPAQRHAFVQVLDGITGHATFHRYPIEEFWAAADAFDLRIGPNRFTLREIALQIDSPERTVHGVVRFGDLTPWPVTLAAPGVMGWYAWVPFMECNHGVLSLDHAIEGSLAVDGGAVNLSGGRGYIEKDWGSSFPSAWIWFQSNHFQRPGTSITASIAVIPWLGGAFRGQIIGLRHEGSLYRFATYTGARVEKLVVGEQEVVWVVRDRRHRLEMRARRAQSGLLKGPSKSDMGLRVPETLQAEIAVRLTALEGRAERVIFEGAGRNGGLEVGGDIPRLLEMH
jgi:tocopherol cyclase